MIKALSYEQLNEVESHFLYAIDDIKRIAEITKDIAEESSYAIDPTGIHGTKMTDTTMDKASRIEKETRELKKWGEVVKETHNHFRHDHLMNEVYKKLYIEKKNYQQIIEEMYIGQTSLYEYRKEILRYGTMRAVAKGLMDV